MELSKLFNVGMSREDEYVVEEQHTARHLGSGGVMVLATPAMIAWMESTALKLLEQALPVGSTSVGVHVDVRHIAPTPVGAKVRVRVEIIGVEGSQVQFQVDAWDEQEQAGGGKHLRAVIDEARFMRRIAAKSGAA